ncbi:MAG: PKD domain-containing protein, partial [Chloroflexi bacterium]
SGAKGVVEILSASPFIDRCEIGHNTAAGIYASNVQGIHITHNDIHDNRSTVLGGGISVEGGSAFIQANTVYNNRNGGFHGSVARGAGGISAKGSAFQVLDNVVHHNIGQVSVSYAAGPAGGIDVEGVTGSHITVSGNTVTDNQEYGVNDGSGPGGIGASGEVITFTHNIISNNVGSSGFSPFGGVGVGGTTFVLFSHNIITGNTGGISSRRNGYGGGGVSAQDVIVGSNVISGNIGGGVGGLMLENGTFTVTNNLIENNFATGQLMDNGGNNAGGLYIRSNATANLSGNTVISNTCNSGGAGGITIRGNATVLSNTISLNSSDSTAGGITVFSGSSSIISNTISGNTASGSAQTSGIYIEGGDAGSKIQENILTQNGSNRAIYLNTNNWTVNNNYIFSNIAPYDLYYDGPSDTTLDATNNWWGTTDTAEIANRIWDHSDTLDSGVVQFNPLMMTDQGPSNHFPVAIVNADPTFGSVPLDVTFTASATDVDGSVVLYEWDFDGDGFYDWSSTINGNTSHQYTTGGNYVAVLRVTDNLGLAGKTLVKIGAAEPGQSIDVGGQIAQNQVWPAGFHFRVTESIVVPMGITLTIESGVEVRFASGTGMQVEGTLLARGFENSPIVFTSDAVTPAAGDWAFIRFTDNSVDAVFDTTGDYSGGSVLQHCRVLYGGGSGAKGVVEILSASPFIDRCEIGHNTAAGIYAS